MTSPCPHDRHARSKAAIAGDCPVCLRAEVAALRALAEALTRSHVAGCDCRRSYGSMDDFNTFDDPQCLDRRAALRTRDERIAEERARADKNFESYERVKVLYSAAAVILHRDGYVSHAGTWISKEERERISKDGP